jgi:hypothetical protein
VRSLELTFDESWIHVNMCPMHLSASPATSSESASSGTSLTALAAAPPPKSSLLLANCSRDPSCKGDVVNMGAAGADAAEEDAGFESSLSVFCDGDGGGVLVPPEEELVETGDLRRSITDSRIPVRVARVWN